MTPFVGRPLRTTPPLGSFARRGEVLWRTSKGSPILRREDSADSAVIGPSTDGQGSRLAVCRVSFCSIPIPAGLFAILILVGHATSAAPFLRADPNFHPRPSLSPPPTTPLFPHHNTIQSRPSTASLWASSPFFFSQPKKIWTIQVGVSVLCPPSLGREAPLLTRGLAN